MLGLRPPIFFVSSSTAQRAKNSENELERDALLSASGFDELERYVTDLLDEEGRVRLKLESPLGVVEELVRRYERAVEERVSLLEDDFKMAENVESQLEAYKEDMKRVFEARMAEIENIILSMNERGDEGSRRTSASRTSGSWCSARRSRTASRERSSPTPRVSSTS